MIVWRISNHATIDGIGGLRCSARWHSRGRPIVYCAPNPATALVEVLVHLEIGLEDVPANFQYLAIEVDDTVAVETVDDFALGPNWPGDLQRTRAIGDHWLTSLRSPVLRVPSVVVPATSNLLLNPAHPEIAKVKILHAYRHPLDQRLISSAHPR